VVALEAEDRPAEEDPLRAEDIRDVPHGDRLVSLWPAKAVKYEPECRGVERSLDREGRGSAARGFQGTMENSLPSVPANRPGDRRGETVPRFG
jgi:hypothetical protein